MMTLKQFNSELAKHGCTAEINQIGIGGYDIVIDAPEGFFFSGRGTHCLVHDTYSAFERGERARVRAAAIEDMNAQLPLEKCIDPECDVCHPSED